MQSAREDGSIKYRSERIAATLAPTPELEQLSRARTTLFDLGLIGVGTDGIGYGNVSLRANGDQFLISASATGGLRKLDAGQFCLVEWFSIEHNTVRSRGALQASSESMTHGAIYAAAPAVRCVMHVHSRELFDALLEHHAPSTPPQVAYGTPAIAQAVAQLVAAQPRLPVLFVMAGHDEGLVACGADIATVTALLVQTWNQYHDKDRHRRR